MSESGSIYGVLEDEPLSALREDDNNIPLRPKLAMKRVQDTQVNLLKLLGIDLVSSFFF